MPEKYIYIRKTLGIFGCAIFALIVYLILVTLAFLCEYVISLVNLPTIEDNWIVATSPLSIGILLFLVCPHLNVPSPELNMMSKLLCVFSISPLSIFIVKSYFCQ